MQIIVPGLIILVGPSGSGKSTWAGPSGSGKSTWARRHFAESEIVSSDRLRAAVGLDEYDQRASTDAFAVLNQIVQRRMGRKLTP
jgi:predicted kinase